MSREEKESWKKGRGELKALHHAVFAGGCRAVFAPSPSSMGKAGSWLKPIYPSSQPWFMDYIVSLFEQASMWLENQYGTNKYTQGERVIVTHSFLSNKPQHDLA